MDTFLNKLFLVLAMSSIKEKLLETRPSFDSLDLSKVNACNVYNPMEVRGRIAEAFVLQWLTQMQVEFINCFSNVVNHKRWIAHNHGVTVYDGGNSIREFDFVFSHDSNVYIAEVKSLKLNGIEQKIPRSLDLAQEQFQQPVHMLLFFPQYTNKVVDAKNIEDRHPQVICIDTGYKRKGLENAVSRFYASRHYASRSML